MPAILATWEAEAPESLEHRRWRLQLVEIVPLHSSLSERERGSASKTKLRSQVNYPTSQLKELEIQEQRTPSKLC